MNPFDLYRSLAKKTDSKILLVVFDGLGGHPTPAMGMSELEAAKTPNLDALVAEGACGLSTPISAGITPGSGPAHLGLFGYEPLDYIIGRGVLSALGIGFDLQPGDVAARINFCTMNSDGLITDRRAGRIATEEGAKRCKILSEIKLPGVEIFVQPEMDYRAAAIFRGAGLCGKLSDSDPQTTGVPPLDVKPLNPPATQIKEAAHTANLVTRFIAEARSRLKGMEPANMVLLRGFDDHLQIPSFQHIFKLKPVCIATYPMYKGLSKLVGMDVLNAGSTLESELETLKANWDKYDFFFFHIKKTDSMGEDGDFNGKVDVLQHGDTLFPEFKKLNPDVIAVTGDHSTPCLLKSHSWHPVPFVVWSPYCRPDNVQRFDERSIAEGSLNGMKHVDIMPLLMANALKFEKFGA
ncbi:MAG: 2,3-bisphosphoglycerate-independent phosphoglycerate mutase [Candidatus Eisenbacteria bacterium]|nr:2,3-bisphosphoglycerate-independent phosphoglycerate mutase [Candidatus Eisenbacteria bacterium]MBU1947271.1 2,3-bisphosphoglycerate-independent phosphoglycerate mutase [Candidatus Eisenbacteria bacterium]